MMKHQPASQPPRQSGQATLNVVFMEVLLRQDFINDNEDQNIRQAMEEFEEDQLCGQALDEQQQSEDEWISYEDEWMMQTDGANDLCGQASYEDRQSDSSLKSN